MTLTVKQKVDVYSAIAICVFMIILSGLLIYQMNNLWNEKAYDSILFMATAIITAIIIIITILSLWNLTDMIQNNYT